MKTYYPTLKAEGCRFVAGLRSTVRHLTCKSEVLGLIPGLATLLFLLLLIQEGQLPGHIAQSVGHLTRKSGVLGSIPGLGTYFRFSFRFFKKGICQLLAKIFARSTG